MLLFVLCIITYAFCGVEYKYNEKDKFTGSVKFKTLDDGFSINLPVRGLSPNIVGNTIEHEFYVDEINTEILKDKKITDIKFNAQVNGYDLSVPEP